MFLGIRWFLGFRVFEALGFFFWGGFKVFRHAHQGFRVLGFRVFRDWGLSWFWLFLVSLQASKVQKTIKSSLRPKPKKTANPLALPVSSRFQDGTEGLKFQNPMPGWKAKSVALLVYRDSSGQTSVFSS